MTTFKFSMSMTSGKVLINTFRNLEGKIHLTWMWIHFFIRKWLIFTWKTMPGLEFKIIISFTEWLVCDEKYSLCRNPHIFRTSLWRRCYYCHVYVTDDEIKAKTFQEIAQGYLYMTGIRQIPCLTLSSLAVRPAPVQIRFLFCLIYILDCKIF